MFSFAKLIFRVTLAGTSDRYLLFSFRRIFRDEFMRTCDERGEQLTYEQLFGQALSPDPAAVRRFQKPPLPFVFDFPVLASPHALGNDTEITLMLAGSAVNSLSLPFHRRSSQHPLAVRINRSNPHHPPSDPVLWGGWHCRKSFEFRRVLVG